MYHVKHMLPILVILVCITNVYAAKTIVYPDDDAEVREASPGVNYGSSDWLQPTDRNANRNYRAYMAFNLSNAGTVASANVSFYTNYSSGLIAAIDLDIHFCNDSNGFSETAITWSNQATLVTGCAGVPFSSVDSNTVGADNRYTFDLTNQINNDPDNVFSLKFVLEPENYDATQRQLSFHSKNKAGTGGKPWIEFVNTSGDVTTPVITPVYPVNSTHYNNYNGSIIMNVTDNVAVDDCNINNTDWTKNGATGTIWTWNRTTTSDSNYSIFVQCNDTSNNTKSLIFWFVVDTVNPISTLYSPLNNTIIYNNFRVNLTYNDIYLWRTNTTITNSTGGIMYNNFSGNLGTQQWYNLTETVNVSTWNSGTYTLLREATDTHTTATFDEDLELEIIYKNEKINYKYILDHGEIEFVFPDHINMSTVITPDRFLQEFTYNPLNVPDEVELEIITNNNNMYYLRNSQYPCHLILYNKYWYDCQGLNVTEFTISQDKAILKYIPNKDGDISKSIGGLNYVNWTTTFQYTITAPYTNNTMKLGFNGSDTYIVRIINGYTYLNTFTDLILLNTTSVPTCDQYTESGIIYNIVTNRHQACNGRNWSNMYQLYYSGLWNYSPHSAPWTFDITKNDTYFNLTGLSVMTNTRGFTYNNNVQGAGGSYLTALHTGLYKVSLTMSFSSNNVGGTFGIATVRNFNVSNHRDCYARREASTAVGNVGITCLMQIYANDNISIQVENEDNTRDMIIHTVNLNLQEVI